MELQFQSEYIIKPRKRPFRLRLRDRIRRTYRYDTAYWRLAIAGPWGAGIFAFILAALGMPTGIGIAFDILIFLFLGTFAHFILCHLTAFLLALIGVPGPRLFYGSVLFNIAAVFLIFFQEDQSILISSIVTGVLMIAGIVSGLLFGVLASRSVRRPIKLGIGAVLAVLLLTAALWPEQQDPGLEAIAGADTLIEELSAADPSLPGSYPVQHFNYGSGKDYWQPEFGEESDYITESVDASAYIKKWNRLRTKYWGFDERSLPVNGRVWMPEGSGTFPLVLIVHGNHLMEDYSDDGYAYLGNLLASRGFIAVSVDENFLNYSVWTGIPDNDMKVRAWMLLKHLQQIGIFAEDPESPFYQKVDFEEIALIGHSRGGQAVAMASDYKRWFASDSGLKDMDQYRIQSVAAIAPTDKKVDGNFAKLQNVNYLTLQGARDGDVSDFDGERQYVRTTFTSTAEAGAHFKASLYIADANHSQFNTGWGRHDVSYPKGILLSRQGMLSPADQRQVAKVYISAFLEATLHDQQQYAPMFVDYRHALDWLPETSYFNRFESSAMTAWARFDEDSNRMTLPEGGTAEGEDVIWREEEAKNRRNSGKGTKGVLLERRNASEEVSTYSLDWEHGAPTPEGALSRTLSFAMADRSYELDNDAKKSTVSTNLEPMEIMIELETLDGVSVSLPLSRFMQLLPLPETRFTVHPWLDLHLSDGKYKEPTEAVFQTFQLDLDAFTQEDPRFDPEAGIRRLSFHLSDGVGRVMIDDIGVYEY